MKKILLTILFVLIGAFLIIQLIRPEKNLAKVPSPHDIATALPVPRNIKAVLQNSCYDCHSNNTRYPWYAEVQPIGWFLHDDVIHGKERLNFSEFSRYRLRTQFIKLQQIATEVEDEEMPLPSYLMIHTDAQLSSEQRDHIVAWANAMRDTMKAIHPIDSLQRR
ncbi:MAG: heme-binding domain-containing protein [Ignavibacteriae bacterium]|nr:heme-binding domain-containing protein [Ignavibacteriota bacterium]